MAGQIGYGIANRGATTTHADNLSVGIYRISGLEDFASLGYPVNNGYVFSCFTSGAGFQLFFYGDSSVVFYRHKWNRWSDWKKVQFSN